MQNWLPIILLLIVFAGVACDNGFEKAGANVVRELQKTGDKIDQGLKTTGEDIQKNLDKAGDKVEDVTK
ncbi:MAG: hypothetical protein ACD_62C00124G0016 [uncultured bacterium]|nr:MAG: hypothetical protein ACD_62C00124G0016 [uncultured bacterium]HLD44945.1 hypothetical protein [bacterium]